METTTQNALTLVFGAVITEDVKVTATPTRASWNVRAWSAANGDSPIEVNVAMTNAVDKRRRVTIPAGTKVSLDAFVDVPDVAMFSFEGDHELASEAGVFGLVLRKASADKLTEAVSRSRQA